MNPSSPTTERAALPALTVKVAVSEEDFAQCRAALDAEHSLGAGQPAGRQLRQMVFRADDGELVGLLIWAASAWHLKERDQWIDWDPMTRSQRLGLIVNNSRLLILEKNRAPNLATQVLGTALRALAGQWEQVHGYVPLLAEAFTDLETHHGTSYKASNWIALGVTAGFERHHADFYVCHDRPKKLWVYPLHREAQARLRAPQLRPEHAAAEIPPTVRSPLGVAQLRSLRDVFQAVDDPRRVNSRRYPLSTMLTLLSIGLLCGAVSLSDTHRSIQLLSQAQRKTLGLPRKKGSEFYRVPCYNALRDLLRILPLQQMIDLLIAWLGQHEGALPRTLALDGKDLGAQLGQIVSLINTTHSGSGTRPGLEHDGTAAPPMAMAVSEGKGHEQTVARQLLGREDVVLCGSILTADALHCQHETLHQIVACKGGEYLVSLKDNQPKAAAYAREALAEQPPLFR